jgi:hypothetical protein
MYRASRGTDGAVVPPGARAVASLSDRYLDGAAQLPACNPVEDGTRLWLVDALTVPSGAGCATAGGGAIVQPNSLPAPTC